MLFSVDTNKIKYANIKQWCGWKEKTPSTRGKTPVTAERGDAQRG